MHRSKPGFLHYFGKFLLILTCYLPYNPATAFTSPFASCSIGTLLDTTSIPRSVLQFGLVAEQHAQQQNLLANTRYLTLIDFSEASNEKRLWLVDLTQCKVVLNTYVAHGSGSGDVLAQHFSNTAQSHASSIGVYKTGNIYQGSHGASLQLYGLEPGVNSAALSRHIVVHGATYVGDDIARKFGRVGRSWGCPAVSMDVINNLISYIKNGSLMLIYYPDRTWLASSQFLH